MPTKNPRINVMFEEKTANTLMSIADYENKSISSLVRELTLEALDLREDFYLSKITNEIDIKHIKTCSHDEAWQ